MKHTRTTVTLLAVLAAAGLFAQQEVVLKISEGMPMISLALPEFVVRQDAALFCRDRSHGIVR